MEVADVSEEHAQDCSRIARRPRVGGCRRQTKVRDVPKAEHRRAGRPDNRCQVRFSIVTDRVFLKLNAFCFLYYCLGQNVTSDKSETYISQGSVATHLRCGGLFSDNVITVFLLILTVKEF